MDRGFNLQCKRYDVKTRASYTPSSRSEATCIDRRKRHCVIRIPVCWSPPCSVCSGTEYCGEGNIWNLRGTHEERTCVAVALSLQAPAPGYLLNMLDPRLLSARKRQTRAWKLLSQA
jgi:hypothetical protein